MKSSQLGRAWQAGAKHLLLVGGNDLPQRLERNELHYREEPQPTWTLLRFPSRATRSCELEISAVTAAQRDAQEEDVVFFGNLGVQFQ